jgi:NAD(P)-dependent dehydrogenase (short-subunit alcohol dehydrogenase family)
MELQLCGKKAIVTGESEGIGLACAKALLLRSKCLNCWYKQT